MKKDRTKATLLRQYCSVSVLIFFQISTLKQFFFVRARQFPI